MTRARRGVISTPPLPVTHLHLLACQRHRLISGCPSLILLIPTLFSHFGTVPSSTLHYPRIYHPSLPSSLLLLLLSFIPHLHPPACLCRSGGREDPLTTRRGGGQGTPGQHCIAHSIGGVGYGDRPIPDLLFVFALLFPLPLLPLSRYLPARHYILALARCSPHRPHFTSTCSRSRGRHHVLPLLLLLLLQLLPPLPLLPPLLRPLQRLVVGIAQRALEVLRVDALPCSPHTVVHPLLHRLAAGRGWAGAATHIAKSARHCMLIPIWCSSHCCTLHSPARPPPSHTSR
mmetsp:Transcript_48476/g.125766  ORF Transcript_48476/g.125766 Transcript_48476/m.125766 type:complete len:288 (-) Transcript_48476:758-1621(-)